MTKKSQWGVLLLPHGNHFFRTINTHCPKWKVWFPLPEVGVSLIIMQIGQALPENKININFKTNCHRHIYMISIPTFSWSRTEIG